MKKFDEIAFVRALTERDADAREMKKVFNPDWLTTKEYVPVVRAIFDFLQEHKTSPSIATLHEYMADKDKETYEARYKQTLTMLDSVKTDPSKQLLAVSKARENAAALGLEKLIRSPEFNELLLDGEGGRLKQEIGRWLAMHTEAPGEEILDIREGFDKVVEEVGPQGRPRRISTGIKCIDEWSSGGIRPGQLGMLVAPTGNGKSAVLMNIAHHIATVEEKSVLFLTNELTVIEQLERFLVRMQAPAQGEGGVDLYYPLHKVQDDPTVAYRGLQRRWQAGLEKRLLVGNIDLNVSASGIEEKLNMLKDVRGFQPQVIIIDFIERMGTDSRGVSRGDKEYIFFGEIAKELIRLGKRKHCAIWTAGQTNRMGLNKDNKLSMEMGQGSIRHYQEASCVIFFRKETLKMDAKGRPNIECLHFAETKQRSAAMHDRDVRVRTELARMYITDEEVEPAQDTEIEVDKDEEPVKKKRPKSQFAVRNGSGS